MLRHKENLTELKTSVAVSMGEAPTEPTCGFARSRWVVVWRRAGYSSNNHTAEVLVLVQSNLSQFWRGGAPTETFTHNVTELKLLIDDLFAKVKKIKRKDKEVKWSQTYQLL